MFKQPNQGKPVVTLAAFAALFSFSVFVTSCNETPKETLGGEAPAKKEFSMNCVKLTKAQLQAWVDSGWTKPGSTGKINTLLLQFYTADAAGIASNMQLTSYPGTSAIDFKTSGNALLAIDTSCKAKTFTGKVILANNEISLESLKVFNEDGTLKDFDYVRFTPQNFSQLSEYITFNASVVKNGVADTEVSGPTRPCPPICCPPECN